MSYMTASATSISLQPTSWVPYVYTVQPPWKIFCRKVFYIFLSNRNYFQQWQITVYEQIIFHIVSDLTESCPYIGLLPSILLSHISIPSPYGPTISISFPPIVFPQNHSVLQYPNVLLKMYLNTFRIFTKFVLYFANYI